MNGRVVIALGLACLGAALVEWLCLDREVARPAAQAAGESAAPVTLAPLVTPAQKAIEREPSGPQEARDGTKQVAVKELDKAHKGAIDEMNRVLREGKRATISEDAMVATADLQAVIDAVNVSNSEINAAADRLQDYQAQFVPLMTKAIKEAVDAGKQPPYEVLPNGRLPVNRGKYDVLITSSYKGVVYLLTLPHEQATFDLVDAQHRAEAARLDTYSRLATTLFH